MATVQVQERAGGQSPACPTTQAVVITRRRVKAIFALLVSAYFFSYFFRVSASVVLPRLSAEWGMSAATAGLIASLYFYSYAAMQPVSGALNDRFGPLRVVSAGLAITAVGVLMMGFADTSLVLGIGRLLTGLGLAPMLSGALVFQAAGFDAREYAKLSGITYTVGNFGAVVSVAPLEWAIGTWGRQAVFLGLAVLNVVLAGVLVGCRKYDPVRARRVASAGESAWARMREAFATIGRSGQLRAMMVIWAVSFGALMALQGLWAVSWFQTAYGVPSGVASAWATLIGVGVMLGNFFGGQLGRWAIPRRRAIAMACTTYGALWVALLLEVWAGLPLPVVGLTALGLGMAAGVSYVQLTAGVDDLAPEGKGGALFGAVNLFTFVGVILYQAGTGMLLQRFPGGAPGLYTPTGYLVTLGVTAATVLLSLLALFSLPAFERVRQSRRGEI